MTLLPRILDLLQRQGQSHVRVLVGGIIPDDDVPSLKELGVAAVFGPGASTEAVIEAFRSAPNRSA
jgi:methylmalonyl-CoA mutase C-terminal domain/subunit